MFASFCKEFFAANAGGHKGIRAAAKVWSTLTPGQKEKFATGVKKKKAVEATAAQYVGSTESSSGLSLSPSAGIRFGNYTVVQGRAPFGAGSLGQALVVRDTSGQAMLMKLFFDVQSGRSELEAHGLILRGLSKSRLHEAASPFLRPVDFCDTPPLAWMVTPLMPSGDLWAQLKSRRFGMMEAATLVMDAWEAVQYMHERIGLLHLDLKPQNMLFQGSKLYLIDFSLWERWPVPADRELSQTYCTDGVPSTRAADESFRAYDSVAAAQGDPPRCGHMVARRLFRIGGLVVLRGTWMSRGDTPPRVACPSCTVSAS